MTDLTAAAVAVKKNPTVRDLVEAQKPAIERQLAGTMNSDAFVRAVLNSIAKTPLLQKADPATLLGSVMLAAQLKLEIGTGDFHLTPRTEHKGKANERVVCVPIIGYGGYITLIDRAGIEVDEPFFVREGDAFKVAANSERGRFYEWEPLDGDESREWTHVIAYARRSKGTTWVVLTRAQVESVRPYGWDKGPWKTHPEPMAKKTAVRALAKYLPKSTDLGRAIEADEQKVQHVKGLDEVQVTRIEDDPTSDRGEVGDGRSTTDDPTLPGSLDEADPEYVEPGA